MKTRATIALTSLIMMLAACGPEYSSLDTEVLVSPPSGSDIRSSRIELPAGTAALIKVFPRSSKSKPYDTHTEINLDSEDVSIFRASPTEDPNKFVLLGQKEGSTCMEVYINDVLEECIPVTVTASEG